DCGEEAGEAGVDDDAAVGTGDVHGDERGEQGGGQQLGETADDRRERPVPEQERAARLQRVRAGSEEEDRRPAHALVLRRHARTTASDASSTGTPAGRSGVSARAMTPPPMATRRE